MTQPLPIRLAALSEDDWPPLARAVSAGDGLEGLGPMSLQRLTDALVRHEDAGRIVVFAEPALPALVGAVQAGAAPDAAMAAWKTRVAGLLALYRRNRARLCLVSASAARDRPEAVCAGLAETLEHPVPTPVSAPVAEAASAEPGEPPRAALIRLIAGLVLSTDAEARALTAEFEASCLPVEDPAAALPADLGAACAAALATADRADRPDLEAAIADLRQTLAEREAALAEMRYLETALAEQAVLQAQLAAAQDQAEALQGRVVDAEAAAEAARAERAEMDARRDAAETALSEAKAWSGALVASRSWRATAPLRAVSRLFGR